MKTLLFLILLSCKSVPLDIAMEAAPDGAEVEYLCEVKKQYPAFESWDEMTESGKIVRKGRFSHGPTEWPLYSFPVKSGQKVSRALLFGLHSFDEVDIALYRMTTDEEFGWPYQKIEHTSRFVPMLQPGPIKIDNSGIHLGPGQ